MFLHPLNILSISHKLYAEKWFKCISSSFSHPSNILFIICTLSVSNELKSIDARFLHSLNIPPMVSTLPVLKWLKSMEASFSQLKNIFCISLTYSVLSIDNPSISVRFSILANHMAVLRGRTFLNEGSKTTFFTLDAKLFSNCQSVPGL